jgi:hypothetical protein
MNATRKDQPPHTGVGARFEDMVEPDHVVGYEILHKGGFVGHCSQVDDRIHSSQGSIDGGSLGYVPHEMIRQVRGLDPVEAAHSMSSREQCPANAAAHGAG